MPNHKLPSKVKDGIIQVAEHLMARRLEYALQDPPITFEQIQGSAMEPDLLTTIEHIRRRGVHGLTHERQVTCLLVKDKFPGLQRDTAFDFYTPIAVLLKRPTNWYSVAEHLLQQPPSYGQNPSFVVIDPAQFDAVGRERVATWANAVVHTDRLRKLATKTVRNVLAAWIESTGHILARWPMLATLVKDTRYVQLLREPPSRLYLFAFPDGEPGSETVALMRATEPLILGAALLEPIEGRPEDQVTAELVAYRKLATDRF